MEPASTIIGLLGGLTAVSSELCLSVHTVKRWRQPRAKGGTDGFVPREHQFEIHTLLLKRGHWLPVEEIIYTPAQRAELDSIRAQSSAKPIDASSPQNPEKVGAVS